MKRAGVIGWPLDHSLSPVIFQDAFDAAGIDARYEKWETPPERLEARIASLRADDVLGANVTIPHKEAVIALLDRVDDAARQIGAVNTIANEGGRLAGYNTDLAGFERSLRWEAHFDPKGRRAVVLGAGGASRAVVLALARGGAARLHVVARSPERAERLVADLRSAAGSSTMLSWSAANDGELRRVLAEAKLIVNCTPVGTRASDSQGEMPLDAGLLPAGVVVFDLVYNPPATPLLRAARERGAMGVSGLGMLVYQAAESFRIWTGREAPVERMLEAGRAALGVEAKP